MAGNKNISILERVENAVDSMSKVVVYLCLFLMAITTVADALLRSFTKIGIGGLAETSTYLLVLVGFLGISRTQAVHGHISVTFLTDRLSQTVQYYLKQGVRIFLIIFSLLFVYAGMLKAVSAYMTSESDWFGTYIVPVWPFRFAVPVGFFFLVIEVLLDALKMKAEHKDSIQTSKAQSGTPTC